MKFIVVSDSHGHFEKLNSVIEKHSDIETVFFLGDGIREFEDIMDIYSSKKFYCVSGNCDLMSLKPSTNLAVLSEGKILYTHGDAYGVKTGLGKLTLQAQKQGALLALFGHTHLPFFEKREDIYLFNPGSLGSLGSYGICEIKNGEVFAEHKQL